jgi:hypothetical protein
MIIIVNNNGPQATVLVKCRDGLPFTIGETADGALVIRSRATMFAELGKPGEVVVRQLKEEPCQRP